MTSAYSINLNPNITTPVKTGYTFKSGDKGITFNIAVTEMDPTGTSAKIAFHRANGTSVEAALSGQGPTYSYTILGNEFAVPGVVVADVKFYQSTTQRVSTASFVFNVINDTLDGLGGGTAGYSDELETLRAEMEEAAEVLDDYIDAYGELKPLNPCGDYNASTTYHPCDLVTYNNANWICKAECTGQAPATGSAYWMRGTDAASSKADKVVGATNGNLAGLDANGNLTDSGVAASSIGNKANKVSNATNGNLAQLDSSGDLVDSGILKTTLSTLMSRFYTGYIGSQASITVPSGAYIMFIVKTQYAQSVIYFIDGNGVLKLAGNENVTVTRTVESGNFIISWTGVNYFTYFLIKAK